jgi:phage shock protein E
MDLNRVASKYGKSRRLVIDRFYTQLGICSHRDLAAGVKPAYSVDNCFEFLLDDDDISGLVNFFKDNAPEVLPIDGAAMVKAGAVLVDVRSPAEFARRHIPMAINLSLGSSLEAAIAAGANASHQLWDGSEVCKRRDVVLYCNSGARAATAKQLLATAGFTAVLNAGAMDDWPGVISGSKKILKCLGCGEICDGLDAFQTHCATVEHGDDFMYDHEEVPGADQVAEDFEPEPELLQEIAASAAAASQAAQEEGELAAMAAAAAIAAKARAADDAAEAKAAAVEAATLAAKAKVAADAAAAREAGPGAERSAQHKPAKTIFGCCDSNRTSRESGDELEYDAGIFLKYDGDNSGRLDLDEFRQMARLSCCQTACCGTMCAHLSGNVPLKHSVVL